MARHLMAVCVVCILCAEHVPCKEHFENILLKNSTVTTTTTTTIGRGKGEEGTTTEKVKEFSHSSLEYYKKFNEKNAANYDDTLRIDFMYNKRKGRTKNALNQLNKKNDNNNNNIRYKRHTISTGTTATTTSTEYNNNDELELFKNGHHYHQNTTTEFLKKLFKQFGNNDGQTMNIDGFETMLHRLGLYKLIEENIYKKNNDEGNLLKNTQSFSFTSSSNETCISSLDLISRISPNNKQQLQYHYSYDQENKSSDQKETVKKGTTTTKTTTDTTNNGNEQNHDHLHHQQQHQQHEHHYHKNDKSNIVLDAGDIFAICPILLYQLTAPTQSERSGCINSSLIPHKMYLSDDEIEEDRFYVWMYAIASVLGVSLVGLLGVAVIPCMDRHIYQHIIQFLVALAVGTLAGDALLHLLPHSMMTFSSQEIGHESMIWKGLVAVLGIIFLFSTERGLTMIAEWRKNIEKKEKPSSRVRVMRDPDSASINNSITGDKLCKHKYSSYPYCYDEIAMETKDDHHHHHHHQDTTLSNQKNSITTDKATTPITCNKNSIHTYRNSHDHGDCNETAQSLLPHNYTTISDSYSVMNKEDANNPDNNTISTNLDETSVEGVGGSKDKPLVKEETFTIILREHESSHHGHSHKHGHVHSPPRTLSAVAWMVVMGDGLHNFTDGMAIGAAFSNNIAGGFSTAIAVFCHELPHELGDFAVLLKAGMSAKQAVYYNLLSSVLSFMGVILGVIIGDTPEASAWIFACAAGMFIYIALVDMMPELTSTHNERCAVSQCLIQVLGMFCGLGVMLLIALYEHDLKNIFSTSSTHDDHHHNHFH